MAETDSVGVGNGRYGVNTPGQYGSRAGFTGGGTGTLGNYQEPTSAQVGGVNEAQAAPPSGTALRGVSADSFKAPATGGAGGIVGQALAGAAAKVGGNALSDGAKSLYGSFGGSNSNLSDAGTQMQPNSFPINGSPSYGFSTPGANASTTQALSDPLGLRNGMPPSSSSQLFSGASDMSPAPIREATSTIPSSDTGINPLDPSEFGVDTGVDAGADAALDGASGGVPIVGPLVKLAQGDVGGAAGNVAGALIGNLIFPGIGGIIGGIFGGMLGGGGGGKLICTEYVTRGEIAPEFMAAELRYAHKVDPAIMRGYQWWALPYVRLMRRSALVYRITKPFALGWMREAAARAGYGKGSRLGKVVLGIGMPVCWLIGQFVGKTDYSVLYVKG